MEAAKDRAWKRLLLAVCCLCPLLLLSCSPPPEKEEDALPRIEKVPRAELPSFDDDLDEPSLRAAIERSLAFYSRTPQDKALSLGELKVTAASLKASLLEFQTLLETKHLDTDSIARRFDVYKARFPGPAGPLLVTGYYEPVLDGRLVPDEKFCYPLYTVPTDRVIIDLEAFDSRRFPGERLVGRLKGSRVVPYYSRAEIDGERRIEKSARGLVWLDDPIDVFFLHVQGSGLIRLPGERSVRVGYAGNNGRPYRSIGKYLMDKGVIAREEMSLQAIRAYLKAHPEVVDEVLWYNESYVFFRWTEDGPRGSLDEPLTTGRSVATDARYYPRGGLAFLQTEKPRLDADGQVTGWDPLHRWVLSQDAGGAIKGMGRVDLFCGSGEAAERIAGRLKQTGDLFFFVKKGEVEK